MFRVYLLLGLLLSGCSVADVLSIIQAATPPGATIVIEGAAGGFYHDVLISPGGYTVTADSGGGMLDISWTVITGVCVPSADRMTFSPYRGETFRVESAGCTARITYFAARDWAITLQHD